MLWKLFTLALIIGFAWWRLRQFLRLRRLRAQGEPVPEPQGVRPITILAGVMLAVYGGYLLFVLLSQALETFGG